MKSLAEHCYGPLATMLLAVGWMTSLAADEPVRKLQPIGRLPDSIHEASGLCKSRRHHGVFWTHSDSGNPPLLFAITRTGRLLATYRINGAVNLDWESIETDDDGHLYLCDVGNNLPGGPLKTRWIDIVREPNPLMVPRNPNSEQESSPVTINVERQQHFSFPEQAHDVEGVAHIKDTLLLFAKVARGAAPVFALPLKMDSSPTSSRPATLKPFGDNVAAQRITGAALTPKRDRLALCSYNYAQVFELSGDESWQHLDRCPNRVISFTASAVEGCEWDGDNLLLVSEDRQLFDVPFPRKSTRLPTR